ncbi:alanine aminotransferase 1-like [Pungitius pungitius]|uniref:alanine aminotransferase 1-like n=1 Tax=Pungitius pungitius TaxID=134920 RepID=UPI002E0E04F6
MSSLQQVNPTVRGIRASAHTRLHGLATHIAQDITQGALKPFKEVIDVSAGDPHTAGFKPVTFVRQVLAACLLPRLLEEETLPLDVRRRAQRLLEACEGGSVGSYTASSGMCHVRQSIAESIVRRDAGVPSHAKDIFISSSLQRALMPYVTAMSSNDGMNKRLVSLTCCVKVFIKVLAGGQEETRVGVLTPVPCPHTLPALLDEARLALAPYRLAEGRRWAVDVDELHRALKSATGRCKPRAIYISNPGNPTGHVQDWKSIEEVIRFAAAERLLLLVDEVYQDSVYGPGRGFISYKRVLFEMDGGYSDTVELVSFHSLACAHMGEGGLMAGYIELVNIDPEVMHFVDTMLCTDISTPVTGQLALDLMVDPPRPGDLSFDTYSQEILLTRAVLSQNAQRAQEFLNDLPGMSCQPAMGGIYLYPRLHLSPQIIEKAKVLKVEPEDLYCQMLLEEKGVLLGAGCQSGETASSYHLRLCILVLPDTLEEVLARLACFHCHGHASSP